VIEPLTQPVFIAALFMIVKLQNSLDALQSTNEENVVYIHSGVLLSHKEEWNYIVCR
jgi:hypothetical protein